ncbi:hypothetical protein ACHAXT_000470 [Thalassiosira profunda]
MVGTSSAVAACALALHWSLSPCHAAVTEAAAADLRDWQDHLRRLAESAGPIADGPTTGEWEPVHHGAPLYHEIGPTESAPDQRERRLACGHRGYHPDTRASGGCTNDAVWPPAWDREELRARMFHDTREGCCQFLGKREGEGCRVTEACEGAEPASDGGGGGGGPACEWHLDLVGQDGCTDDDEYPIGWTMGQTKAAMFHATPEECCARLLPNRPCKTYPRGCAADSNSTPADPAPAESDVGADPPEPPKEAPPPPPPPPTPAQAPQGSGSGGSCKWHVDIGAQDGCTNDDNFPEAWTRGNAPSVMFHDSADACCQKMFQDRPCQQYDRGCSGDGGAGGGSVGGNAGGDPPPPSAGCEWHVDVANQDGCTDDSNYPDTWLMSNNRKILFHPSAEACCQKMMPGRPCKHYPKGCEGPVEPGAQDGPVVPPPPSPPPTQQPTPSPEFWYVDDMSGACLSTLDTPPPHWIKKDKWYLGYEYCCTKSRDKQACLRDRPVSQEESDARQGRPTSTPTKPPELFYVEDMSGLCVSSSERPPPAWIVQRYGEYEACCGASTDRQKCLRARPRPAAEGDSTVPPTAAPPERYWRHYATGKCVVDGGATPKPEWVAASYAEFSRCCLLESNDAEKCLADDPNKVLATDGEDAATGPTGASVQAPPEWYVDDGSGVCLNLHQHTMAYEKDTFGDYKDCCETSWDKAKCLLEEPSKSPTMEPTEMPSTMWPTDAGACPPPYDESGSTLYGAGSEVESDGVAYRCRPPPYATNCNRASFRPPPEDPGPGGESDGALWREAWQRRYRCLVPESEAPTPTACSKAGRKWHPMFQRRVCTNELGYPALWDEPPLDTAYFADTADDCCSKFYGGTKCRIRDACE